MCLSFDKPAIILETKFESRRIGDVMNAEGHATNEELKGEESKTAA